MHHLTCGIGSLLHSVNLILFTVLLVTSSCAYHLITVTNFAFTMHSHHTITPSAFHLRVKLISFTNPFLHRRVIPSGLTSQILTCTELTGHWRFLFSFVCKINLITLRF